MRNSEYSRQYPITSYAAHWQSHPIKLLLACRYLPVHPPVHLVCFLPLFRPVRPPRFLRAVHPGPPSLPTDDADTSWMMARTTEMVNELSSQERVLER